MKTLILTLLLLFPVSAVCDSYQYRVHWKYKVIKINDPKFKVLELFGQPDFKEYYNICTSEWSYRKNKNSYIVIIFRKGKVYKIRTGRL